MIPTESAARVECLFPVLRELPAPLRKQLYAQCAFRIVPAGTTLFAPGNPCTGFPLVVEGSARAANTTPRGRETLLYRVEPGESGLLSGRCVLRV